MKRKTRAKGTAAQLRDIGIEAWADQPFKNRITVRLDPDALPGRPGPDEDGDDTVSIRVDDGNHLALVIMKIVQEAGRISFDRGSRAKADELRRALYISDHEEYR